VSRLTVVCAAILVIFALVIAIKFMRKPNVKVLELKDARWVGKGGWCVSGSRSFAMEGRALSCDERRCVFFIRVWIFAPSPSISEKDINIKVGEQVKSFHLYRRSMYLETRPILVVAPPGTQVSVEKTDIRISLPNCLKVEAQRPPAHIFLIGNVSKEWKTVKLGDLSLSYFIVSGEPVALIKPSSSVEIEFSGDWGSYKVNVPGDVIAVVSLPGSFTATCKGKEIMRGG